MCSSTPALFPFCARSVDPGYKAVGGLIGAKAENKSAFDGKAFGREDDDELEHERNVLSMVGDAKGNHGSEFYIFLGEGSTVCAAQMDTKHQVIGSLVGGVVVTKKIEQLMHDNFNSDNNLDCNGNTMRALGGRPVSRKAKSKAKGDFDKDAVIIAASGTCEWSAKDAKLEAKAVDKWEKAEAAQARTRSGRLLCGPRGERDDMAMTVAPAPARGRRAPRQQKHQSVA